MVPVMTVPGFGLGMAKLQRLGHGLEYDDVAPCAFALLAVAVAAYSHQHSRISYNALWGVNLTIFLLFGLFYEGSSKMKEDYKNQRNIETDRQEQLLANVPLRMPYEQSRDMRTDQPVTETVAQQDVRLESMISREQRRTIPPEAVQKIKSSYSDIQQRTGAPNDVLHEDQMLKRPQMDLQRTSSFIDATGDMNGRAYSMTSTDDDRTAAARPGLAINKLEARDVPPAATPSSHSARPPTEMAGMDGAKWTGQPDESDELMGDLNAQFATAPPDQDERRVEKLLAVAQAQR